MGVPPEPHCHRHAGSHCATSDQIARVLPYRTHAPTCGVRSRTHAGCCLRGACVRLREVGDGGPVCVREGTGYAL